MFSPSREDVRRFFIHAWRKERSGDIVSPIEAVALKWIRAHPEYHALLDDNATELADFSIDQGQSNPFLHLSMHLALDEQCSIDQPTGIRAVLEQLQEQYGDAHDAQHAMMECLGEILWRTQRGVLAPDPASINAAYLDCLKRLIGPRQA